MANIQELYDIPFVKVSIPTKTALLAFDKIKISSEEIIGIEIEVENVENLTNPIPKLWSVKEDGSLRNQGQEFVTAPFSAQYAPDVLNNFFSKVLPKTCSFSPRTSIHVHLNVQDLTLDQVKDLTLVYTVFERLFFRFAGRGRMKNIFCVPLIETHQLHYLLESTNPVRSWQKYSALNLAPVSGFGTVEFRHLAGTFNTLKICQWIELLTDIKKYVLKNDKVRELLLTSFNVQQFLREVFGEHSIYLKVKSNEDFKDSLLMIKLAFMRSDDIQIKVSPDAAFMKVIV